MTFFTGFDEAVVVDVETTGLDPMTHRIVSVAMIRANFGDLREHPEGLDGETRDVVVNPQCRIPEEASRIHGITNKDVAEEGTFSDAAQELRDFIGDLPVIAHNVSFDKKFLSAEFKRAGVKTLSRNKSYCTMRRFQDLNDGHQWGSNLDNVVEAMGAERRTSKIHDALEDARLAFQVAALFYMMDNHIQIPSGRMTTQSQSRQLDVDDVSTLQHPGFGLGYGRLLISLILLVLLLIWLLY